MEPGIVVVYPKTSRAANNVFQFPQPVQLLRIQSMKESRRIDIQMNDLSPHTIHRTKNDHVNQGSLPLCAMDNLAKVP